MSSALAGPLLIEIDYLLSEHPGFNGLLSEKVSMCLPASRQTRITGEHRVRPHTSWAFKFRCTIEEKAEESDIRAAIQLAQKDSGKTMVSLSASSCSDLAEGKTLLWLWGVPTLFLLLGSLISTPLRSLVWLPAFLVMGVGCLVNAYGCGRLHCYFTGPVFLGAAGYHLVSTYSDLLPAVNVSTFLGTVYLLFASLIFSENLFGKYLQDDRGNCADCK
jgi:hypothetical protein